MGMSPMLPKSKRALAHAADSSALIWMAALQNPDFDAAVRPRVKGVLAWTKPTKTQLTPEVCGGIVESH